jgi:hypothetical protein
VTIVCCAIPQWKKFTLSWKYLKWEALDLFVFVFPCHDT